jgi:hypothetical protein
MLRELHATLGVYSIVFAPKSPKGDFQLVRVWGESKPSRFDKPRRFNPNAQPDNVKIPFREFRG